MKILAICPRAPFPPDRGDRIRSYQLLRRLGESHQVDLAAPDPGVLGRSRIEGLAQIGERRFVRTISPLTRAFHASGALLRHQPLSAGWYHDAQVARTVENWVAAVDYDVVLVSHAKMAPYWMRTRTRKRLPAVLDFVDVASEDFGERAAYSALHRKWVYRRERWLMRDLESEAASEAATVVVVSEAEAALLRDRLSAPVQVIENGVDGGSYARPEITGRPSPRRICFVGRLDVEANVDAVRWYVNHVHPRVLANCEPTVFDAVGAHPVRDLRALRKRRDVCVTGWVEDVRPYLWRASVAVAPLRIPTGTTNGVLEAMAASVPVVATPAAARGLVRPTGDHIAVAEDSRAMAAAICALLADPERRAAQVRAGLDYVHRHHSWDRSAKKLEDTLRRAARGAHHD